MLYKYLLQRIWVFAKGLLFVVVSVVLYFYLSTPIYRFAEPVPFHGKYLHNPYQQIDSNYWRKYNFQVQSRVWAGITDGRLNSAQLIDSIYNLFEYDYVAISDYQLINPYNSQNQQYIPTYEHGINIPKVHQVCLGARKILWRDYFLFQTLNTKQHIINKLRPDCELIALAHPRLRDGYTLYDMKYLHNYDLIEVLNNYRVSVEHWDQALSFGHLVYILANDDAHNVLNSNEVNRRYTLIHSKSVHHDSIIQALGKGLAYGVDFYRVDDELMQLKIERSKHVPYLKLSKLFGDTLKIVVSESVNHIRFVGEQGIILSETDHVSDAQYVIKKQDAYVRVEIHCNNASVLYLNPVTRHENNIIEKQHAAEIDLFNTWLVRSMIIVTLAIIILLYWYKWKKKGQNT
jgi:hypothetical protein